MTVKKPPTRRPRVAGYNRRPSAVVVEEPVEESPVVEEPVVDESPVVEEPAVDDVFIDDDPPVEPSSPRSRVPLVLIAVSAVLVGLGSFFLVKGNSVDQGGDTRALTEVNGQVKDALEKVFSFSYDKVDETSQAARQVLAGTAIDEYDKLVATVRAQAPAQKLVLATRVTSAGVKSVDSDHAELLVFLDQVATRVDNGKSSGSAAALSVKVERQNGTWKITELTPR
jgi:Mce-associated membrane protein